jgi:hypothetical protein
MTDHEDRTEFMILSIIGPVAVLHATTPLLLVLHGSAAGEYQLQLVQLRGVVNNKCLPISS